MMIAPGVFTACGAYPVRMPRWEPDGRGRLEEAALDLFQEQGFDATTVAQVTERAGLTKRSFFSHFADKREIMFSGSEAFEQCVIDAIRAQPGTVEALDAAVAALASAAAELFEPRRPAAIRRGQIIAASSELQERSMVKRADLAGAIGKALRDRGSASSVASLSAWSSVTIFFAAFAHWTEPDNTARLDQIIDRTLDEFLQATTSRRQVRHAPTSASGDAQMPTSGG